MCVRVALQDVKDTLDHTAVCKLITSCYVIHQVSSTFFLSFSKPRLNS